MHARSGSQAPCPVDLMMDFWAKNIAIAKACQLLSEYQRLWDAERMKVVSKEALPGLPEVYARDVITT